MQDSWLSCADFPSFPEGSKFSQANSFYLIDLASQIFLFMLKYVYNPRIYIL